MNIARLLSLDKFPTYVVEIGVFSEKTDRKEKKEKEDQKSEEKDSKLTNAEILFINENGSPLRQIPSRPVLQYTIDWARNSGLVDETLEKCLMMYLEGEDIEKIDREVNKLALKMQNYARRMIKDKDKRLAPNAPSTIQKKGENYPLHDTGQLARSITCVARKMKAGEDLK